MAKYTDNNKWEEQILIVDEQTPVFGGQPEWDAPTGMLISGFSNISAAMLADRTRWLRSLVEEVAQDIENANAGALLAANNLDDLDDVNIAKQNLGLDDVDNTTDADKPISTAAKEQFNTNEVMMWVGV